MPLDLLGVDASRASGVAMTGTEWYSREIIQALARLEDRPQLRLYQRAPATITDEDRVEHRVVRPPRFWTHLGLAPEVRRAPPDALFIPAHVIPLGHPRATVVTIHDVGYRTERNAHTARRRLMLDMTTRWSVSRAARIIVPSHATGDDLQRYYGVDPTKIDVIHHGIDHQRFKLLSTEETAAGLRRLGLRHPFVLFLSTVQPRKNVSRLIAAFEALDDDNLTLVIAGSDGWLSEAINRRISGSVAANRIKRMGYVANEDVPALYNGAATFALPSLYEGFGMGIIEAMACGCPVVTSNVASLPEIAGDAAIIVDPLSVESIRDGLRLALDADQRERLRQAGLRRAAQFTWDCAADRTLESIQRAYTETTAAPAR